MKGWFRVHRKIINNPIFNDMKLFRLWMICLAKATHTEHKQLVGRQMVNLSPGEFVTGRFELHFEYNNGLKKSEMVSERTLWRWLKRLEEYEYLSIKSYNKYSVVTVDNWSKYQHSDQSNNHQVTTKRPTDDHQVTTNNNDNNANNKDLYIPYDEIIHFLNEMTGKSYRSTTRKTRSCIDARWNEGFDLDDFKTVIKKKTAEWKHNVEMNKYLRPETLFGTKFESYLNQSDAPSNVFPLKRSGHQSFGDFQRELDRALEEFGG